MNKIKRFIALIMVLSFAFSMSTFAFAIDDTAIIPESENSAPGIQPFANYPPTMQWDWSRGEYESYAEYVTQYTYSLYSVKPNTNGYIYYKIDASSDANKSCTLNAFCMDCNDVVIGSRSFYPNSSPLTGTFNATSHKNHDIGFKLVVYDGPAFFSDNDFSGFIYYNVNPYR